MSRNKQTRRRTTYISKQQREAILSHLFQEARRLTRKKVPLQEIDRQLRLLKTDLLAAVRAGVTLAVIDSTTQPENSDADDSKEQS